MRPQRVRSRPPAWIGQLPAGRHRLRRTARSWNLGWPRCPPTRRSATVSVRPSAEHPASARRRRFHRPRPSRPGVLMTTAVATPVPVVNLLTVLSSDFASACRGFRQARDLQRTKETPAPRAALAEAREGIDAVLDMYLATRHVTEVVA